MKFKKIILLDADVPCYQFAFKNQVDVDWDGDGEISSYADDEDLWIGQFHDFVKNLQRKFNTTEVCFALSDTEANFRKDLYPEYKNNRKQPKPLLWAKLRNYIELGDHGFRVQVKPSLEGDDILGIIATSKVYQDNHVVVTIDKDLETVPCNLYLYNKPKLGVRTIDEHHAHRFFMTQVLTGDSVDNYKGLKGCGPVGAKKILDQADEDGIDYWTAVVNAYEAKGCTEEDALLQARLAYILQNHNFYNNEITHWEPNNE